MSPRAPFNSNTKQTATRCRFVKIFLGLMILPVALPAQDLRITLFERLSVEHGLSYNGVQTIHQDSRGFLWIGTSQGLNRHDGYSFEVYKHRPGDSGSLSENIVVAIHEDRRGRLWIGTEGGGLNLFERGEQRFRHFRHDPSDPRSLSQDYVNVILEDRTGVLWVGCETELNRFDGSAAFTRYLHDPEDPASLASNGVEALLEDSSGRLWIGTENGLELYDRAADAFVHYRHDPEDPRSLMHPKVTELIEDRDGTLWLGTEAGLDHFDPRTGRFIHFVHDRSDPNSLSPGKVHALWVDRRGELWVGTLGGLCRLDRERGTFLRFRHDPTDSQSLSSDMVRSIYEDRTGILWFGTTTGLNKYVPAHRQFAVYRQGAELGTGLSSRNISTVVEDQDGGLWIGTLDRGLDHLDAERRSVVNHGPESDDPAGLPSAAVEALYLDRTGALWVGGPGGLARLEHDHRGRRRFVHYKHDPRDPRSLANDSVLSLFEDSAGRLWVGTVRGLELFDRASDGFLHMTADSPVLAGLGWEEFYDMLEDRSGELWFAAYGAGLYRLDPTSEPLRPGVGQFVRYRHDPRDRRSLSTDKTYCLHEDRSGALWIGTFGGGLNRLDPQRTDFTHYGIEDGLPSEVVYSILEDDEGFLWLATGNGLVRTPAYAGDPGSMTFSTFDVDDGLPSNSFSDYSAHRSRSGEMFFGTSQGLVAFFPSQIHANDPQAPEIAVTGFSLFNEPVPLQRIDPGSPLTRPILNTEELVLNHRDQVFSFEFSALHYSKPRKNRYAYKLEGFDKDWVSTGASKRSARYTNLAAGRYVFRVKGSNGDGVWNDEGTAIRITVLPPPWKTWWAYTLYFLVTAALASSYLRSKNRKIEQQQEVNRRLREVNQLKDEFLANTSHELRTPLHGITGIAESMIGGAAGELPDAAKANLAMMVASGRRLSHLVDDILDFSKLRHESLELARRPVELHALVDVVLTLSAGLVGSDDLKLVNAVAPDLPAADADENRLQQILYNLIGNAIKFTEQGTVEVSAAVVGEQLVIQVDDTGIGIPEDQQERIFDAFEQADASIEREHGGTGLGLAVTRRLVEIHRGTICLKSTPGVGSTFSFSLPIAAEAHGTQEQATPSVERHPVLADAEPTAVELPVADPGVASRFSGGPRVLVVDDEPVNLQVVCNYLAVEELDLTLASSGEQALRLLEQESFDLVLLDIMMPRISGYEVCRSLREHHSLSDLPVIFLTARSQDSDVVTGMALGANDYLMKPISRDQLLARVRPHLELLHVHRHLEDLVEAKMAEVKVLEGFLPICARCKKIRDGEGNWENLETYIDRHSEAQFSHGLCPDCVEWTYEEYPATRPKAGPSPRRP